MSQGEKLIVDRRSLRNVQIHPYDNKSQALAVNSACHCSKKRRRCSDCGHLINRARAFNKAKCLSRDYHYGKQYKTGQLQRFIPFLCHSHIILANKCVFFFSWSYIAKLLPPAFQHVEFISSDNSVSWPNVMNFRYYSA